MTKPHNNHHSYVTGKAAKMDKIEGETIHLHSPLDSYDFDSALQDQEETVRLSPHDAELVRELLKHTAAGHRVAILDMDEELTTQQAADLLKVSRPHVVKLMNNGILKGHKVGTHRRLYADEVIAYKRQRDAEKRAADELTALSQELGLYE